MRKRSKEPATRGRVGIRWRLFVCLALFTAVILLTLWLFQVRLLSHFYEKEKFTEINVVADELEAYLTHDSLDDAAERYAIEHGICICVFRVKGEIASCIANAEVAPNCVIHHLGNVSISQLYESAKDNDGVYDKRFEFNTDGTEFEGHLPAFMRARNSVNAIHVRVTEIGGEEYVLMLDCEMTPLGAMVKTLEMQFIWIAIILLIAAVLFAMILSHIVAKPLILITQKAGQLSAGKFDVEFPDDDSYREVQELADALKTAASEIGATDRLQRELIANISHDLRTPLTMIKGYSEMMRDIPGENSPENIQAVIDETTRLSELVNDLMDLSKLQAGTRKPDLTVFDFTETLRDVMVRYDTLIRHKGYCIDFELQGSAMVRADRTMILQVIYNLINNAVNYTGESLRVRVTEMVGESCVRLSIADDGEGIPPDQIKEIWHRYYRVDKEHKRAVMGTGLGLSIVKEVLESHGAAYGVDSAVGVGSIFWFELPLVSEPEEN